MKEQLLARLKKLTASEFDRSIPRMPRAICVLKVTEEEKAFLVSLLEKMNEGKADDQQGSHD